MPSTSVFPLGMAARPEASMSVNFGLKLATSVIMNAACLGIPLFLAAGTLDWWRAWILVGLMFAGGVVAGIALASGQRGLLDERLKKPLPKGQPFADKILVLLLLAAFFGLLVFTALDVFRIRWMSRPGTLVSLLGMVAFVGGWWIAFRALQTNAFASQVVRLQEERTQVVVDRG